MNNPFIAHLHILQLEEYKPRRFLRWWIRNPLKFSLEGKKPLVWTNKAKFIYYLSGGFWPLMFVALLLLKPYEVVNRWRVKWLVRGKIRRLKKLGLKVIGITGSYGKTSTKEFLYQILKTKHRVLRTPESYNTVFGISKVVDWELDENYDFFVCEMGAYKIGEVAELCRMVEPDYGILTGINEQHLERFGSLANTIRAKFELVDFVRDPQKLVLNFGNELVRKNAPAGAVAYGQENYKHPSEQNIEGAAKLAQILGISRVSKDLKLPPHRLTLVKREKMTVIDDAYSGNVDGFKAAVAYLKSFKDWKVIVTPGIAELGRESLRIHQSLGKLLVDIDQIILVGKNDRTRGLEIGSGRSVEYVGRVGEAISRVKKLPATVLFENDLPDNY